MKRPKRPRRPVAEVLAWLQKHHPTLHATAETDRDWLWIVCDLRGDENKPTRQALKDFGFRFAVQGHSLPSGQVAHWGHSCEHPLRFKRRVHLAHPLPPPGGTSLEELAAAFA